MPASSCVTFTFQRRLFYQLFGRSLCRYQGDRLVCGFAFPKCTRSQRHSFSGQRFPPKAFSFLQAYLDFLQHPLVLWIRNKTSQGFTPQAMNSWAALYAGASVSTSAKLRSQEGDSAGSCRPCTCRSAGVRLQTLPVTSRFSCHFKWGHWVFDKQHQTWQVSFPKPLPLITSSESFQGLHPWWTLACKNNFAFTFWV